LKASHELLVLWAVNMPVERVQGFPLARLDHQQKIPIEQSAKYRCLRIAAAPCCYGCACGEYPAGPDLLPDDPVWVLQPRPTAAIASGNFAGAERAS